MQESNYYSDSPITSYEYDKFNRFPFAQHIAKTISDREDSSSIVIGINGKWGEGKTSVLNFIEKELKKEDNLVCLTFNPWRFESEEVMLMNFFKDLATAIDRSLETEVEKAGEIINRYLTPVAQIINKRDIAEGIHSFFSTVDINIFRSRIEKLLKEEKKRVVILIDDIDRLDKYEIYAMFRLIKLTADFDYTSYILAFDKNVVAASLKDRYIDPENGTGDSFLEKIIQVPLKLPPIEVEDLRNFCFQELDKVLSYSEISMSENEVRQFAGNFSNYLELHIHTPRQVKLYSNSLMFSLPLLKGEANIIDLMLIEAIKVLLPNLYDFIKDNRRIFLRSTRDSFQIESDQQKEVDREKIDEVINTLNTSYPQKIKQLLYFLFPKTETLYRNLSFGPGHMEKWSELQRICSEDYFNRYFSYAISDRDISDLEIESLINDSEVQSIEEVSQRIKDISTEQNVDSLVTKLRNSSSSFTLEQSKKMAVAIAHAGNIFPNPIQLFKFTNTFSQAAILTSICIENISEATEKEKTAKSVLQEASTLEFAVECFSWLPRHTEERPNHEGFDDNQYSNLGEILAKRIEKDLTSLAPAELSFNNLSNTLSVWYGYGNSQKLSETVYKYIESDDKFVFNLLNSYTPTSFTGYTVGKGDLSIEGYESIKNIISPQIILGAIEKFFDLNSSEEKSSEDTDIQRYNDLAKRFRNLYENEK
ncbi:KAP family P-loop NTPase fold protein [Salinicoccus roseus]|uniref:KAP family P-loop NTPase fold protein n=1 Tax=Salinicoccus roseus TaxID=45670 RepID=UPI002300A534|nr:P-loop NTPase fold protein [Salinicoccus roseus]